MSRFSEGQKVRYTGKAMALTTGKTGTVKSVHPKGWVDVVFDGETITRRCAQANLQIVDPRGDLLQALFDQMTEYLVDECPGDQNWEDFDPDIDGLRAQVILLQEAS